MFANKHTRIALLIVIGIFLTLALSAVLFVKAKNTKEAAGVTSIHCAINTQDFRCLKNHYEALTRAFGPRVALDSLKAAYAHDSGVVTNCHQLGHVIGNTAIDMYKGNIAEAFTYGDSICWSGYYHGAVEAAVEELGEEKFIASANTICSSIPGKEHYSFDYYNCVHGLGHGVMELTDDELFEALPLCDNLSGDWERRSCYGGVFMENIMQDSRYSHSKYLKKNDLMYPCNSVSATYKEQCYLMQTSYALSQTNYDFKNTFTLCANVEFPYRDICAQSIGRDASGSSVSEVAPTVKKCSFTEDDNQQKNCIIGAVKDFVSYFRGGGQAALFCMAVPERFKKTCEETRVLYANTL